MITIKEATESISAAISRAQVSDSHVLGDLETFEVPLGIVTSVAGRVATEQPLHL